MSAVFISHSSADNDAVQAGRGWERLYRKLRTCRAVVARVAYTYLASRYCFAPIALAR